MFSEYFYNAQIKKTITVFGTLFNDISVVRLDNDGNVKNTIKVPLAYGPKQKFLARLKEEPDLDAPEVAIRLPRMSFEITDIAYDPTTKLTKIDKIINGKTVAYNPVPYNIQISLNIISKTQDDALQILEQILPFFTPHYTVTINEVPELNIKRDIPITLTSISSIDDYEGEFTNRRTLIYTLNFAMKVFFYGNVNKNAKIIKEIIVNERNYNTSTILSTYNAEVDPRSANKDETYTIIETKTDFGFD